MTATVKDLKLKFEQGDRVRTRDGHTGTIFQVLPADDGPDNQTRYIVKMDFMYQASRPGMDELHGPGWSGTLLLFLGKFLEHEVMN